MGMKEEDPRAENPGPLLTAAFPTYARNGRVEGHGEGIAKTQISVGHKNFSWMRVSQKIQTVRGRNK